LTLRLMAGALQFPFVPLRSAVGSDIGGQLESELADVTSPFGDGTCTVASPIVPDIAIVHALAADEEGHAVIAPPYAEDNWAAKGAAAGIIVCAEKIVPRETIRQYSGFVKFPAASVMAVCETPHAAAPYALESVLPTLTASYPAQSEILAEYGRVVRDRKAHRRFLRAPLGSGLTSAPERSGGSPSRPTSASDRENRQRWMVLAAARRIVQAAEESGASQILVGVGLPLLPTLVAEHLLRGEGKPVELVVGSGLIGYEPGQPIGTAMMVGSTIDAYGIAIGGRATRSIAVLSAAEIDPRADMNLTVASRGELLLNGSGGSNDAALLAAEVVLMATWRPGRLVEKVDFVTSPGAHVRHFVTDYGTYAKELGDSTLQAQRRYPLGSLPDSDDWATLGLSAASEEEGPSALEAGAMRAVSQAEASRSWLVWPSL
jgi:acyl CoA:acetate/3-ketoacid CoA transferase beta subunit